MECVDFVERDVRTFGISGDWRASSLQVGKWYNSVLEGGRRFMITWRIEEHACETRQEKRMEKYVGNAPVARKVAIG